jgi:hypothetical protein
MLDEIAVEVFLKACKDKRAAEVVLGKEPQFIGEALKMIKASVANLKALFGTSSRPILSNRKVSFGLDKNNRPDNPGATRTLVCDEDKEFFCPAAILEGDTEFRRAYRII